MKKKLVQLVLGIRVPNINFRVTKSVHTTAAAACILVPRSESWRGVHEKNLTKQAHILDLNLC